MVGHCHKREGFAVWRIYYEYGKRKNGYVNVGDVVLQTVYESVKEVDSYYGYNEDKLSQFTEAVERTILCKLEVYCTTESKKYFRLMSDDDAIVKYSEIIK